MRYCKLLSLFIFLSFIGCSENGEESSPVKPEDKKEVSFEENGKTFTLAATGFAEKKDLYDIASYLQKGAYKKGENKIQTILNDDYAKEIILLWTEYVNAYSVQESYNNFFNKNLDRQQYAKLKNNLIDFVHFFNNNIEKGDKHVLRWIPGGLLEVYVNDEKIGSIKDPEFVKVLWTVWFGDKAVVDSEKLTSLMN